MQKEERKGNQEKLMDIVWKCHATNIQNKSEMSKIYTKHEKKRIHDSQTWVV